MAESPFPPNINVDGSRAATGPTKNPHSNIDIRGEGIFQEFATILVRDCLNFWKKNWTGISPEKNSRNLKNANEHSWELLFPSLLHEFENRMAESKAITWNRFVFQKLLHETTLLGKKWREASCGLQGLVFSLISQK